MADTDVRLAAAFQALLNGNTECSHEADQPAPYIPCTACRADRVRAVFASKGLAVVPAEDLRTELEHNKPVPMTVNYVAEAHARLRAALPATEETRDE